MKIEVKEGRLYKTRDGQQVGPMVRSKIKDVAYPWKASLDNMIVSWPDDGRYLNMTGDHHWDLIEELDKTMKEEFADYAVSG